MSYITISSMISNNILWYIFCLFIVIAVMLDLFFNKIAKNNLLSKSQNKEFGTNNNTSYNIPYNAQDCTETPIFKTSSNTNSKIYSTDNSHIWQITKTELKFSLITTISLFVLTMLFCSFIYLFRDKNAAMDFITGYILELTLSVDNIFAFIMVFQYCNVPYRLQRRVLMLGIYSAIFFRMIIILFGTYVVQMHYIMYLFGAILIFGGYKIMKSELADKFSDTNDVTYNNTATLNKANILLSAQNHNMKNTNTICSINTNNISNNTTFNFLFKDRIQKLIKFCINFWMSKKTLFVIIAKKLFIKFSFSTENQSDKLILLRDKKIIITPLLLSLLLIEKADILFAVDSLAAILTITQDYFIILTSNVFAILGLRSLYIVFVEFINRFYYIKYGISVVLLFLGIKIIIGIHDVHISTLTSLTCVVSIIAIAVICSIVRIRV